MTAAMVRMEACSLRYGNGLPALDDVSLHLQPGAFRWLLGPSGAGKSSLLRLLHLAIRPSAGRLWLMNTEIGHARRSALSLLRRRIGMVFQDFRLLPHLSVYDNVALPLRLACRSGGQIKVDVSEMLRWVGLSRKSDSRPAELSGGEQQRVAIARAVAGRPSLLLADEPTGNLDSAQAERLLLLLRELNRLGTTILIATHNRTLIAQYPAPALRLEAGRLMTDA